MARGEVCVSIKVILLVVVIVLACVYPGLAAEASNGAHEIREAIRRDDVPALTTLLKQPGRLEARNESGETPLLLAARLGSPQMVRAILDLGADAKATDSA